MKAHWAYLKYVIRHKWFVYQACGWTGAPWWRSVIHDWSKFLPCEWFAYVRSFYLQDGTKRDWKTRTQPDKVAFNKAWNHHQKSNKHHWQYWVLTNDSDDPRHKPLPMPEKYVKEMVADWMGAGRAITGTWDVWTWYEKNKEKMMLDEGTRVDVENLLDDMKQLFRVAFNLGISL